MEFVLQHRMVLGMQSRLSPNGGCSKRSPTKRNPRSVSLPSVPSCKKSGLLPMGLLIPRQIHAWRSTRARRMIRE